jgi:hypothetical protein
MMSHEVFVVLHVAHLCFRCHTLVKQLIPILDFADFFGVLEDWLNRLHDTESSLHIVDLWLHAIIASKMSTRDTAWSCDKLLDIGIDATQCVFRKT